MDYQQFTSKANELEFIRDEQTADAAVKAVLGILASRLPEPAAHDLADNLPEPLTFDKLRASYERPGPLEISTNEYVREVGLQFKIPEEQAGQLIKQVLSVAKETIGEQRVQRLTGQLPDDWATLLQSA